MQHVIDLLKQKPQELVYTPDITRREMVADIPSSKTTNLRDIYNTQFNPKSTDTISEASSFNPSSVPGAKNILARIGRLVDATTTVSPSSSSNLAA